MWVLQITRQRIPHGPAIATEKARRVQPVAWYNQESVSWRIEGVAVMRRMPEAGWHGTVEPGRACSCTS